MSGAGAYLYYGYILGCPEDSGWDVQGVDEYGNIEEPPAWLTAAEDDDDNFPDHMNEAILTATGASLNDFTGREVADRVAEDCGVRIVEHGSAFSGVTTLGLALAQTVEHTDDWTAKLISPAMGATSHGPLDNALAALGLTPLQAHPSWILAPDEG